MTDWPIAIDPTFNCHVWQGKLNSNGRPVLWRGSKPQSVIRMAIDCGVGLVPDHLCRNVQCVNKLHLEAVTPSENELRKSWAYRCKRTTCPKGHSMEGAIVTPQMGRLCRTCHKNAKALANMGPDRPG